MLGEPRRSDGRAETGLELGRQGYECRARARRGKGSVVSVPEPNGLGGGELLTEAGEEFPAASTQRKHFASSKDRLTDQGGISKKPLGKRGN